MRRGGIGIAPKQERERHRVVVRMTRPSSSFLGMSRSSYSRLGVALALIAGIGAIDWWLPLGLTITTLYVVPVLIASRTPPPRRTCWVAALASLVTILDMFDQPFFALTWVSAVNRAFALMVIWVTALLCLRRQRDEAELLRINEDIEQQVQERTADLAAANQELEVLRAGRDCQLIGRCHCGHDAERHDSKLESRSGAGLRVSRRGGARQAHLRALSPESIG